MAVEKEEELSVERIGRLHLGILHWGYRAKRSSRNVWCNKTDSTGSALYELTAFGDAATPDASLTHYGTAATPDAMKIRNKSLNMATISSRCQYAHLNMSIAVDTLFYYQ